MSKLPGSLSEIDWNNISEADWDLIEAARDDELVEIPEISLVMFPRTPEARAVVGFEWNDDAGRGHKLGGRPNWIQFDETPVCDCAKAMTTMTFYGQLDCIGDRMSLGDCGMIYVFVCQECLTPKAVLQTR